MIDNNKVNKIEQEKDSDKAKISKEDIIKKYMEENKEEPTWKDKLMKDMEREEKNEYNKFRKRVENEIVKNEDNKYSDEDENNLTKEELNALITYTNKKVQEDLLPEEEKIEIEKSKEQEKFMDKYFEYHNITNQSQLNYAVEHDEKFRMFLEKTNKMESHYTGKHLKTIEEERDKVLEELKKEAVKDKRGKIIKKFNKKKNKDETNKLKDSKKSLDLAPYINKKLEKQGYILCFYLRKNGLAEMRYVRMDEVGQIKVDGYVYHERDATYRFGKKNTPVLVIMEGSLVPVNKETLKENLGCESAEAQKLIIKGIEQAEVVKSSGVDENAKKPFAPPKWVVAVGIAAIIGIYAFMGGFS